MDPPVELVFFWQQSSADRWINWMKQSSGESDGGDFGRRISIVQLQDKKLHYGCSVTRHAAFIKKKKEKNGGGGGWSKLKTSGNINWLCMESFWEINLTEKNPPTGVSLFTKWRRSGSAAHFCKWVRAGFTAGCVRPRKTHLRRATFGKFSLNTLWVRLTDDLCVRRTWKLKQQKAWPAIFDIWLGVRTVPVLSVAKEDAAPARSSTGRGAPEHRQVNADWLIDDRVSRSFWVFFLFVDVSFSSWRNHRARDAYRVFKADVLLESKNSAWFPSSEIDVRSWPLTVIVRVLRGRVRLGKVEKYGGRRRRIHNEKTKTITIMDTRIRIHTSTSRRVKVKSTFGGPPCMRRSSASVHGMHSSATAFSWSAGRLRASSWHGLKHSVATSSG